MDGGVLHRAQKGRLEAFLMAFHPNKANKLEGFVDALMRPVVLELKEDARAVKLDHIPEKCCPINGFRDQ